MKKYFKTALAVGLMTLAGGLFAQADHPAYLHAIEDLRAARWMIDHRPGNWEQSAFEKEAVRRIDTAINEIKMASIDDGKDINSHPKMDEKPDRAGRLHQALDYLNKARADVAQDEDNLFAKGLQKRAFTNIDAAIKELTNAIGAAGSAGPQPVAQPDHPAYLHAIEDLRAARWMIDHRPGNWEQTAFEIEAVRRIDTAINEIKLASIDDGKDINSHPKFDEKPDRAGRLHQALDFLNKARADVAQDEDNTFAKGLQKRAYINIDAAIESINKAING